MCGACTVLVDGDAVRSCLIFAVQADGAESRRSRAWRRADGALSPVQEAFRECHGLQCGFCTPGFVVSVTAFLARPPRPRPTTRSATALSGNLCRCTGYQGIVEAVRRSAAARAGVSRPRSTVTSEVAATGFVGQRLAAQGGRPPAHRARAATSTTSVVARHAPRRLRAQRRRPRHDRVDRRRPRRVRSPVSSAVLTGADLNPLVHASWVDYERPGRPAAVPRVLAEGDVRFVGEPIALVVATSRYIAEDALRAREVDIDPLPAVVGADAGAGRRCAARAPRARRPT